MLKRMLALLLCLGMLPLCATAEEPGVVGAWTLLYGMTDGERMDASEIAPNDLSMLRFSADGKVTVISVKDGVARQEGEAQSWTITGRLVMVSDAIQVTLQGNGLMRMAADNEEAILRRATAEEIALISTLAPAATPAPARGGSSVGLNLDGRADGVEETLAFPAGAWAMTPVTDLPAHEKLHSISPSGRYLIMELEDKSSVIYDLETGAQTPITLDIARTRSVQDDHGSLEKLSEDALLKANSATAWSADERYMSFVRQPTSIQYTDEGDLYVLDVATGLVFMPAAWKKDCTAEGFGMVMGVTFAPDGTLYALVHESAKDAKATGWVQVTGPYVLYACNPDTGETTRIHELAGMAVNDAPLMTCLPNGDVVVYQILDEKKINAGLLVGAQRADMQQLDVSYVTRVTAIHTDGKGGVALQLYSANLNRSVSSVSLLDFSAGMPVLATSLLFSSTGMVSEMPLLVRGMAGEKMVSDQWREIASQVNDGTILPVYASAYSPDGTQMLLGDGKGAFSLMDLATRAVTPVYGDLPEVVLSDVWWSGEYVLVRSTTGNQLYRIGRQ